MTSNVDPTVPEEGRAYTANVRANFQTIKDELEILGVATDPVTLAGDYEYLSIAGQTITRLAVNLGSHVTGTLPASKVASEWMRWMGQWTARNYLERDMVLDGDWTMIANKDTDDRAAPQTTGDPTKDLGDTPAWVEESNTSVVRSGHEYTLIEPGWINAVEVWAPELTADTTYRVFFIDKTDPENPVATTINAPVLNEDRWTLVMRSPFPFAAGTVFQIILDALNSGSDTTVAGGWTRAADINQIATDPGSGAWGTRVGETNFRINITDLDTTDRSTELLGMTAGTSVVFVDTLDSLKSMTWTVNGDPTDYTTHVGWPSVTYDGPGPSGPPDVGATCTMTAKVPVPSPTKYEELADHWPANAPAWATVKGILAFDGVAQSADADAFGVRIEFQPAYSSPDWDLIALSGSGGGGSGVGTGWEDGTVVADWGNVPQTVTGSVTVDLDVGHVVDWTLLSDATLTFASTQKDTSWTVIVHSGGFVPAFAFAGTTIHAPAVFGFEVDTTYWASFEKIGTEVYWSEREMT